MTSDEIKAASGEAFNNTYHKIRAEVSRDEWDRIWSKAVAWAASQSGKSAFDVPGYEQLADVLQRAYDQAARGKGKERHANGKAFHKQPMQDLIRLHGVGFATGQASKKSGEALGLPTLDRQVAELLGAIVYLSGAVIALESQAGESGLGQ